MIESDAAVITEHQGPLDVKLVSVGLTPLLHELDWKTEGFGEPK